MVIGVTGCPGSGKSVLAGVIEEHGWILVDADKIGREVVENDPSILGKLANAFGQDIIDDNGNLNRHLVALRAFADPRKNQVLNDIVHPALINRLKSRIDELKEEKVHVVVDCALIFEWGIESLFDVVVCAQAHEHIRKERMMKRDNRSSDEVDGMFSAQLPESEKVNRADIVLTNNGSIDRIKAYGLMLSELPQYLYNEK